MSAIPTIKTINTNQATSSEEIKPAIRSAATLNTVPSKITITIVILDAIKKANNQKSLKKLSTKHSDLTIIYLKPL